MEVYIDLKEGISPVADMANVPATNNGSSIVRCTFNTHGLVDGAVVAVTGSYYVGFYVITLIDNNTFDLNDCVFTQNRTLTKVVHVGGSTWNTAINNIKMLNYNNTLAELNINVAKTPFIDLGINATFTNLSNTIVLDSELTKVVDDCIGNTWTTSPNITGGTSTVRHFGATSQQFTIPKIADFPVGNKVAFKAFPTTQNFSAYRKLSFWFASNVSNYGIQNGSCFKICLCSDADGDVIVNELPLFDVQGYNNLNSMVLDNGSALGNNINSVAIYLTAECRHPTSPITIIINNIVACNVLHHETIVGKNNGTGFWNAIKYINGTTLAIMSSNTVAPTAGLGFEHDTTENTAIYGCEGISKSYISSAGTAIYECRLSNNIKPASIIFGVNKSNNQADGYTYITTKSLYGTAIIQQSVKIYNLIAARISKLTASSCNITNTIAFCMPQILPDTVAYSTSASPQYFKDCKFYNALINEAYFGSVLSVFGDESVFNNCYFGKLGGIYVHAHIQMLNCTFDYITTGLRLDGGSIKINNAIINNALGTYYPFVGNKGATFYLQNCIFQKEMKNALSDSIHNVFVRDNNGIIDDNYTYDHPIYQEWQTTEKPTGGNGAWNVKYKTPMLYEDDFPKRIKVLDIAVEANKTITLRLWVKNGNTSTTLRLNVKHDNTETNKTLSPNQEWVEHNIQITPTNNQVITLNILISGQMPINGQFWYGAFSYST